MKKYRGRKIITLLSIAALSAGILAGCGGSSSEGTTEGKSQTVNIGTMNLVNGDLIAQYEKYYESELGVDVNLVQFDSGKDVNTALASGSIDISQLGSAPTALGISNDVDLQVVFVGDVIGSAETLVAKNDSGISSLEDLKGKKVATPFASTAHYSLLNALKLEGISETDVEILDMQPNDIYAAWTRGDIDAAYVWYPVLSELLEDGTAITDSAELADKGVITADLVVARSDYAEANPEVVTNYIKAQLKANDVILNDADTAAKEVASELEISEEDAASQLTQFSYLTGDEQKEFLTEKAADTLKSTADFLVEQNSIKSAPELEEFESRINIDYLEDALK